MKYIILLAALTVSFKLSPVLIVNGPPGIVYYDENRPITWDDFKQICPPNMEYDANIKTNIRTLNSSVSLALDTYYIEVAALVEQHKSCVSKPNASDYLLKHEQYHFKITEYCARLLRKKISETTFSQKYRMEYYNLMLEAHDNANRINDEYDEATNHSQNREAQGKWQLKIDSLLTTLNDYKSFKTKGKLKY